MLNIRDGITPAKLLTIVQAENLRLSFSKYVKAAWPQAEPAVLKWNWHIDAICEHLVALSMRDIRFLQIQVPPRMSKSLICTILWPTWHWITWPEEQFLCASYSSSLSLEHSILARRVIQSGWYQTRWGSKYYLLPEQNTADDYRNSAGGYRLTTSVGGRTTGEGGSIQLLDDPHNAQDVESDVQRASALSWHDNAWRSRVNDPNTSRKLYVAQRTHDSDILGHVLEKEGDRWVALILPMEHNPERKCITYSNDGTGANKKKKLFEEPRKEAGELLNPKRFNAVTAAAEKEAMSERAWNAQMQQQPEGAGGLILKRKWWRPWTYPEHHKLAGKEMPMPNFFEIIQTYDTAFEEGEENDYSARTTWGLFIPSDEEVAMFGGAVVPKRSQPDNDEPKQRRNISNQVCAMMLDKMYERLEYPDLRDAVIESAKDFLPDKILIEKKASGHSLLQEMRRRRLPVVAVKVFGDLRSRVHASSVVLKKGCIFYVPRTWAFEVINIAAKYPAGDHDDLESTLSMSWQYMRQWHGLQLPDDEIEDKEISPFKWKRATYA